MKILEPHLQDDRKTFKIFIFSKNIIDKKCLWLTKIWFSIKITVKDSPKNSIIIKKLAKFIKTLLIQQFPE